MAATRASPTLRRNTVRSISLHLDLAMPQRVNGATIAVQAAVGNGPATALTHEVQPSGP
jgi:hypothetical protein